MLTRAKETNKPARRSPYPTEKEALAMHTEPFKGLIEETLMSIQSQNRVRRHIEQGGHVSPDLTASRPPRLVRSVGEGVFPCPVRDALKSKYPDMLSDAVLGFRLHGLSKCLESADVTMETFSQDLMKRLAKVDGCWPALLDHDKADGTFQYHQLRTALWLHFYNYSFEMTRDYKAAYKFVELYKDEIDRFVLGFKLRASKYGPNDTVSVTAETLDHIRSEILMHGECMVYPIEVVKKPSVVLS